MDTNNKEEINPLSLTPGCKVHFIGIGGSSMSGIAEIILARGYQVSGSDRADSPNLAKLRKLGAQVYIGHDANHLADDTALVVYTLAIAEENPEYQKALAQKIPLVERGKFLGFLTREHEISIAVAGTHGKTTTTSMIASVLLAADKDPSVHLGGIFPLIGGNVRASQSPYFVTEACEYHANFLNLSPFAGVILNVEEEHLDYYRNLEDIQIAFRRFVNLLPANGFLLVNADNTNALEVAKAASCPVHTYGSHAEGPGQGTHYHYTDLQQEDGRGSRYTLCKNALPLCSLSLPVPGLHNVLNSVAAAAVGDLLGCTPQAIEEGLAAFTGTARRFERKGHFCGAEVVDDYAHHPTEIAATLQAAREQCSGTIWSIFQPHTYSRARNFRKEFAQVLEASDQIIVTDIYAAREPDPGDVHSTQLVSLLEEKGLFARYMPDFDEILRYLQTQVKEGDMILTLGAGTITQLAEKLAAASCETE